MADELSLERIVFLAGKAPGAQPLEVKGARVIVLVGPNNSGKSLALREIEQWATGANAPRAVVADIDVKWPADAASVDLLLRRFEVPTPPGNVASVGHFFVSVHSLTPGTQAQSMQVNEAAVTQNFSDPVFLRQQLLRLYTARLDGRTRFQLAAPQGTGDLQGPPQNQLWALFQDDVARKRVRELTQAAFGLYFVVDPTSMTQFRIRLSAKAPVDDAEEQSLDAKSRAFHAAATPIEELSDGVQTFTGLVSAILSLPQKLLLVDEPEAFLHPPLARRLGRDLSKLASEREASLVVATHSADFLIGCIEANASVAVARLNYESGVATAQALDPTEIQGLMRDPLLRSTGALRALFHRAAIVTEADADRAFYEEVNRRLVDVARGFADAIFLNAQNWQTVSRVVQPLRKVGLPAAAVLDLDAIEESSGWPAIYKAVSLTQPEEAAAEGLRLAAASELANVGRATYKPAGLASLSGPARAVVEGFTQHMATFGVFIVPVGELEGWLAHLGITAKKKNWITQIFSALGSNPDDPAYVKAGSDDAWAFVEGVTSWLADPQRRGMP